MRTLALAAAAAAVALPLWAQDAQQPAPAEGTTPAPTEGTGPAEPAPAEGAAPAESAPPEAAPKETAPAEAAPTEAAPTEAAPAEAAPAAEAPPSNAGDATPPAEAGDRADTMLAEPEIEDVAFPWEGPFGFFDQVQLQRGLQVYTEVCAACHGLKYVSLRSIEDLGYDKAQVRAYAAAFTVIDEDNNRQLYDPEAGALRPLIPADNFPANNTQRAPDLSLMAKARAGFRGPYGLGVSQLFRGMGGPEYIVNILAGYTGEEKEEAGTTLYANTAFPGGWIGMPPPLEDGRVEYADGSANDVRGMAEDTAAFLTWAAEPKMMARKQVGFLAVIFLGLLSVLLYFTNKRLWAKHKGKAHA